MAYSYRRRTSLKDLDEDHRGTSKPETMSAWLQRHASSHQTQLVGTAFLSGLAVATTIFGVQALRRRVAIDELKASIPNVDEGHRAEAVCIILPLLALAAYADRLSEAP